MPPPCRVSDASHIQMVWKKDSGDLDLCLDTAYLIFVQFLCREKSARRQRLQNVNVVHHSRLDSLHIPPLQDSKVYSESRAHGKTDDSRRYPEGYWISPGDETICDQYVNFSQCVCEGRESWEWQVLTSLSLSRHVFCWPGKAPRLDMERLLPGNLLRFLRVGQGSLETGLLTSETNLKAPLLLVHTAISCIANKICQFVFWKITMTVPTVSKMLCDRSVNEVKRTALSRVSATWLRN